MCMHIQKKEKEIPVNLKPQNSPKIHNYTHHKKGKNVGEIQNHSNSNTHTHTHKTINISIIKDE